MSCEDGSLQYNNSNSLISGTESFYLAFPLKSISIPHTFTHIYATGKHNSQPTVVEVIAHMYGTFKLFQIFLMVFEIINFSKSSKQYFVRQSKTWMITNLSTLDVEFLSIYRRKVFVALIIYQYMYLFLPTLIASKLNHWQDFDWFQ